MSDEYSEKNELNIPSIDALKGELLRERKRRAHSKVLRVIIAVIFIIIAIAAAAIILVLPIYQISGSAMAHTLNNGDIVVGMKTNTFYNGDVIVYQFEDDIQVKRVIGRSGDKIDIDSDGNIFVNGAQLNEPYVKEIALGECDLEFPFQVPLDQNFVVGDNRSTSIDSRSSVVGCIKDDDVIGKILFRVWPINVIGAIR